MKLAIAQCQASPDRPLVKTNFFALLPPSENESQINIEDQQTKNLITSSHTLLQEQEQEESINLKTQNQNTSIPNISVETNNTNILVSQLEEKESISSLVEKNLVENKNNGGDVVYKQIDLKHNTKNYDSALGINPPGQQKNLQQLAFNWVPDGVWKINGKLDPNFVDWLAKNWQKAYGGDFHKKRADVLRHFKKDPANIAIAWNQYESETRHRYENAAVRMHNGMEIKAEEQQKLLSNSRAVTQKMSDCANPVAVNVANPSYLPKIEGSTEEKVIQCQIEEKPPLMANNEGRREQLTKDSDLALIKENLTKSNLDSNQSNKPSRRCLPTSAFVKPKANWTVPQDIPRNEDGCIQNPQAYRVFSPSQEDVEPVDHSLFREKLASLSQRLAILGSR